MNSTVNQSLIFIFLMVFCGIANADICAIAKEYIQQDDVRSFLAEYQEPYLLEDEQGTTVYASQKLPNIVFILADDLGYEEIGSYGQERINTPNLDKLAGEGLRFTEHYAGNAVCAPSRSVLMSGRHPGNNGVRANRTTTGKIPLMSANVLTIAEMLKARGYTTGAFGKWGLGMPDTTGSPLNQGFDTFFGYYNQRHAHSHYPEYLWNDSRKVFLNNNPPVAGHEQLPAESDPNDPLAYKRYKGDDYAPDRINAAALDFVRKNKNQPFFLYYPTILPHLALHIPDEYLKPYLKLGWKEQPFTSQNKLGYTPHLTPKAAYAAMVTRLDHYVGEVVKLLDDLGLADDTLIVFTSDNGTSALDDEVDATFFSSVGELRGLKGSLYEGGIRVPAIVRWPGKIQANTVTKHISGFEDWYSTFMELTSTKDPSAFDTDGQSLLPLLLGKNILPREFLYREYGVNPGWQSVRVGNWKAIRPNLDAGDLSVELYDLDKDAAEKFNVASKHPDITEELTKIMDREHSESKLYPLPSLDTSAFIEKLEYRLRSAYHDLVN